MEQTKEYRLRIYKLKGWGLLELLVVIAISTILTATATVSFNALMQKSYAQHAVEETLQIINLARQSAISNNTKILLCGSNSTDHHISNTTCQKANIDNWIIANDSNNNNKIETNYNNSLNSEILHSTKIHQDNNYWLLKVSFGRPYLRFSSEGKTMEVGSLIYCPNKKNKASQKNIQVITINYTGRAYLVEGDNRYDYMKFC